MTLNLAMIPGLLSDMMAALALVIVMLIPTFALGFVLSVPLGLMRLSSRAYVRWPATAFTVFFRGVPMLVVLYVVYYGFAQVPFVRHTALWSFFREPVNCAIFVFTINHMAFLSEIWRGGFRGVRREMFEAAQALSLPRHIYFWKVQFPLAFRLGLSAYRNEIVMFVKSTAAVGAIAVVDILAVANDYVQETFDPLTPLVVAGLLYWTMVQLIQLGFDRLEARLRLPS